jgi:uncharacterized repeat protein (TIGR04138 family)
MQSPKFEEVLRQIIEKDPRYHHDAYLFMREALEFTQRNIRSQKREQVGHVTGTELLDGIRRYALEQFGPMVMTVLAEWGVRCCEDFGELVFIMVEHNLLAKTDNDTREDFKGGYSFGDAFQKPYLPSGSRQAPQPKSVQV